MKTVTFTYVRHGRTEFNRDHVIQGGRVDSPLDPAGLPSIHATAAALADLPFARCYASPLGRVLQTAAILVDGRDLPVRTLDDLREFDFGDIDGQAYPGRRITFARCFVRQDFSPVHGEKGEQVRARVRRAFATMYDEADDGDQVLVVGHGAFFRYVLLEYGEGSALARKLRSETIRTHNASIATVVGSDGNFRLTQLPLTAKEYLAKPKTPRRPLA